MKIEKRFVIDKILIILLVIFVGELAYIYGEFLWFRALRYASVFWTILLTKGVVALLFGIFFILITGINVYIARRFGPKKGHWEFSYRTQDLNNVKVIHVKPGLINKLLLLVCVILGIAMGMWPAFSKWDVFLRFLYQAPFPSQDPLFHKNIGFYIFTYPVYLFLKRWLLYTFSVATLLIVYIYLKDGAMNLKRNKLMFTRRTNVHLSVLAGIILLIIAWGNWLETFGLLYSNRGVVFGAGYTDMNAQLIAYWVIIVIASICAFIFWINAPRKGWKWPIIGLVAFAALSLLVSLLCPYAVQKFIVEPNELNLEKQYIKNNIKYTRQGYNLDQIEEKDFQASTNLTSMDIQRNVATIKNVKLWDKTPLKQTYSELQEMRLYYNFIGVDEDRYTFNGEKTQVMLSVREIDQSKLPRQAQTFENRFFKYTHGYGLCMSPVNSVTEKGLPNLIMKDIPPVSSTELRITRPEIYYREKINNDFIIVNSRSQEFDYPKGDINVYSKYQGIGGVPIGSYINRLVYSIKFIEPRLLFTGYIAPQSRIMFHRQIRERVKTLAPFLAYDRDPYVVVSEKGRIFWIQDAYTITDRYPYSERYTLFKDAVSSPRRGQQPAFINNQQIVPRRINYIRNSVKIIIDAYNGTTDFYITDETDPIIQTYQKIFPILFKPFDKMPKDLHAHIRYPRDLFEVQAKMYQTYHMRDPQVFYNKEDLWDLPMQKSLSGQTRFPMRGYYIIMRLPKREMEEFMLMVPFTPDNKSNTIAWMCAHCDGPDYGKLLLYKFPKEKLIYGPRQVEARIDQQTEIASLLTLWSQQGSDVLRGDLLVIPIEESILYIEPVFLIADDKSNLPELKRVILAYGEKIEMAGTLSKALCKIFGDGDIETEAYSLTQGLIQNPAHNPNSGTVSIIDLAKRVTQCYQAAQESIRRGNWAEYGQHQQDLQQAILNMRDALEGE